MVGNTIMEGTIGGSLIEQKALMRKTNTDPDWLPNLVKSAHAKHLYEHGHKEEADEMAKEMGGKTEEKVIKKRAKKRGMKALMEKPPEPEWTPPPPQPFKDLYELKYRKFWPAMEALARRQGSGPARLIEELGEEWRSARVVPTHMPNVFRDIAEAAGADARAARAALGGAQGRDMEDIAAVDTVLPVPQPQILQARPKDLDVLPAPPHPGALRPTCKRIGHRQRQGPYPVDSMCTPLERTVPVSELRSPTLSLACLSQRCCQKSFPSRELVLSWGLPEQLFWPPLGMKCRSLAAKLNLRAGAGLILAAADG